MPEKFHYKAKNKAGEYSEAEIEAETEKEALHSLEVRGLWVIKLEPVKPKNIPTPVPKVPKPKPQKTSSPQKNYLPAFLVFVLVACVALLSIMLRFHNDNPSEGPVDFKILSEDDYSSADYERYEYSVEVHPGVTRGDIRKAAQDAYAQKKKENPKLQEAMFSFYYPGQQVGENRPIAVLRWNWDQSKAWEFSFTFERGKPAESPEKNIALRQTGLVEGKYVSYEFVLSNDLTIQAAEKVAKDKMEGLRSKWLQTNEIRVDLIYEGFDDPFMKCILKPKLSTGSKAECKINRI